MALFFASLAAALALLAGFLIWRRTSRQGPVSRRLALYAGLGGVAVAFVAMQVERLILDWTGLAFDASVAGAGGALMATFLLAAPLEEAAKVLVIWPLYRTRRIDGKRLGVCYATMTGAGFAAMEGAWLVLADESWGLSFVRVCLGTVMHLACSGAWGYSLGAGRVQGRWFSITWLGAVLLHGLFDHILWGRGPGYLAGTLPLLAFMGVGAWIGLRDIGPEPERSRFGIPRPTFRQVQQALRGGDKPVMLRWVVAGSFVTLGLVIFLLTLSVVLGRRFGVDFALADEADMRSATPLMLLGTAVLLAFPISGYLVARASGSPSVLEPALANLLALAAMVTVLALTAPIAVLFALAVAPVALGLSCAGAWIGLEER
ncbi:MAG TPA: PrsW family glutamic-type intramembrane protease [Polyangiaceae bacterium]